MCDALSSSSSSARQGGGAAAEKREDTDDEACRGSEGDEVPRMDVVEDDEGRQRGGGVEPVQEEWGEAAAAGRSSGSPLCTLSLSAAWSPPTKKGMEAAPYAFARRAAVGEWCVAAVRIMVAMAVGNGNCFSPLASIAPVVSPSDEDEETDEKSGGYGRDGSSWPCHVTPWQIKGPRWPSSLGMR